MTNKKTKIVERGFNYVIVCENGKHYLTNSGSAKLYLNQCDCEVKK